MEFDPNAGVPLAHYLRDHPDASVRFICRDCNQTRDLPLADVVAGLKARGEGDETTGIRAIGRLTRRPCERCRGRRFETRPAWPSRRRDDLPDASPQDGPGGQGKRRGC